jgi:phosphate uptake regulator
MRRALYQKRLQHYGHVAPLTFARMHDAHTSSEFDELLGRARLLLARMGARVERQLDDAIECLGSGSTLLIDQVMRHELERIADEAKKIALCAGRIAAAREEQLDASLRGVLRSLISYMVEDPRTISSCLDLLFVAKSFERIGDHATNIFEHVIYAVRGENVRHAAPFSPQ